MNELQMLYPTDTKAVALNFQTYFPKCFDTSSLLEAELLGVALFVVEIT